VLLYEAALTGQVPQGGKIIMLTQISCKKNALKLAGVFALFAVGYLAGRDDTQADHDAAEQTLGAENVHIIESTIQNLSDSVSGPASDAPQADSITQSQLVEGCEEGEDDCEEDSQKKPSLTADKYAFEELGVINVTGKITQESAATVIDKMHYLDNKYPNRDITLRILSGGGNVMAGMALYGAMWEDISNKVNIEVSGYAGSIAAFVAATATGETTCHSTDTILIHQPRYFMPREQLTDHMIVSDFMDEMQDTKLALMSKHTGTDKEVIRILVERDQYLNARTAQDIGICDNIKEPLHVAPVKEKKNTIPTGVCNSEYARKYNVACSSSNNMHQNRTKEIEAITSGQRLARPENPSPGS
jgi:ATP-dependent Clp protease protease subunit